ncbi:MAG: hypothetical protein RR065_02150 [Clostridia bacterium]
MQAIALHPQRGQILGQLFGLGVLAVGMLAVPALCLPLGLLMPLFACPLIGLKQQWCAFVAIPAPALITLMNGGNPYFAMSLLLLCGLPVVVAEVLRSRKRGANAESYLPYMAAYAVALLVIGGCATWVLGGDLVNGLADWLTSMVQASPNAGETLYKLAVAGLVAVPDLYRKAAPISFLLDPVLIHQLLLSYHLTLELLLTRLLAPLFVQACLICGLFTSLRVQKLNHCYLLVGEHEREKVQISLTPGFGMINLPPAFRWPLLAMGVCSLLLSMDGASYAQQLSMLMSTVFTCSFELIGAAVAVCLLCARKPEWKPLFGALAALLYVLAPIVLFLIGILDPVLHFRTKSLFPHEKEE